MERAGKVSLYHGKLRWVGPGDPPAEDKGYGSYMNFEELATFSHGLAYTTADLRRSLNGRNFFGDH